MTTTTIDQAGRGHDSDKRPFYHLKTRYSRHWRQPRNWLGARHKGAVVARDIEANASHATRRLPRWSLYPDGLPEPVSVAKDAAEPAEGHSLVNNRLMHDISCRYLDFRPRYQSALEDYYAGVRNNELQPAFWRHDSETSADDIPPWRYLNRRKTKPTLYDYFNDVKQSSVERRRLLDEVVSLQSALEALQRLVNVDDPASTEQLGQLLGPSQSFYEALRKALTDVEAVLRNGVPEPKANRWKVVWGRLVAAVRWTADKAEVKALLSDLERQKSRIMIALQHDMFKKQDEHISNEDRLKIAQFISKSDYGSHQIDLLEKRLSGTGVWLLQHRNFTAWRDNREPPRTLWCYGNPGVGKSVAAALIVDHLQSTGNIVLCVFCKYSEDNFTSPFPVLRGLLRQLIERSTRVPSTICERYWKGIHPTPDDLPRFLAEAAAVHARPIYIVIDALDECKIGIDLLCAIQQLDPTFRILITSRPVFKEIGEHVSIKICSSKDDILVAVDTTLSKLKHAWLDEELKDTIRRKVVFKAHGMFLLASLQLRELERDVTCQRDVIDILHSLPCTLDDAYKLTFQRIRDQGERKNELACRTLAVISMVAMYDTVVRRLLAEMDRDQEMDIETIIQCCHGLVQRSSYQYLDFTHRSMYEYTSDNWSELFPENPNQLNLCLKLAYSALNDKFTKSVYWMFNLMASQASEPEELNQTISLLSTPTIRASHVEYDAELASFVHDPLLIGCYSLNYFFHYQRVIQHLIQIAPPTDVQRFNDTLRVYKSRPWEVDGYTEDNQIWPVVSIIESINARTDMQVNSDGVVVAVGSDGGEGNSSLRAYEDDKTSAGSSVGLAGVSMDGKEIGHRMN